MSNKKVKNDTRYVREFAKNLSRIRKQKGMSTYDVARVVGLSYASVSRYERAVSKHVPIGLVDRFAEALGVLPTDLVYNDSDAETDFVTAFKILTEAERAEVMNFLYFTLSKRSK